MGQGPPWVSPFGLDRPEGRLLVRTLRPYRMRVLLRGEVEEGQRCVAVGPGAVAVGLLLAELVGPGGEVLALDPSESDVKAGQSLADSGDWNNVELENVQLDDALQRSQFDRYVPPGEHATFASWRDATQAYQANLVRRQIETLRRLKYRPTGGFAQFCFADGFPGVTWSVLDHDRVPKQAYSALVDACRPVIVVADRLPAEVRSGDALALDVHVVSDLRAPIAEAAVTARLSWSNDEGSIEGHRREGTGVAVAGRSSETWRWQGEIPTDSCVRVGTVSAVVPSGNGNLILDLEVTAGEHQASNRYAAHRIGVWRARRAGR